MYIIIIIPRRHHACTRGRVWGHCRPFLGLAHHHVTACAPIQTYDCWACRTKNRYQCPQTISSFWGWGLVTRLVQYHMGSVQIFKTLFYGLLCLWTFASWMAWWQWVGYWCTKAGWSDGCPWTLLETLPVTVSACIFVCHNHEITRGYYNMSHSSLYQYTSCCYYSAAITIQ